MADVMSKYLAIGVGLFAIAGTMMMWIRRTSRELRSTTPRPDRSMEMAMMARGVTPAARAESPAAALFSDPLTARAVLEQRGIPAQTLDAMSARELSFMLAMIQSSGSMPGVAAAPADATRTAAGRAPAVPPDASAAARPTYRGTVHCPSCGGVLGEAGPLLHRVTRCPSCARSVAIRLDGPRVSVEVEGGAR